jgi:hypothetical protein
MEGGVVAGLLAGLVLLVVRMVCGLVLSVFVAMMGGERGGPFWGALKLAAYPLLGQRAMQAGFDAPAVFIGLQVHFALSAAWGVLFALFVRGLSRKATMLAGALWGLEVWALMSRGLLPLVGARALVQGQPQALPVLEHLAFGVALALVFLPYQRPAPVLGRASPWR